VSRLGKPAANYALGLIQPLPYLSTADLLGNPYADPETHQPRDGQKSRDLSDGNKSPLSPADRRRNARQHPDGSLVIFGGQWPIIGPVPKTSSGSDLVRLEASIAASATSAFWFRVVQRLCLCLEYSSLVGLRSKTSLNRYEGSHHLAVQP
jgi:hypothetical protein